MLQSMGSRRAGHDLVTEQQQQLNAKGKRYRSAISIQKKRAYPSDECVFRLLSHRSPYNNNKSISFSTKNDLEGKVCSEFHPIR